MNSSLDPIDFNLSSETFNKIETIFSEDRKAEDRGVSSLKTKIVNKIKNKVSKYGKEY